jgi:probable HAF family extracellular repeat protein
MQDLGALGGIISEAGGINDRGQVAGYSYTSPGGYEHHAVLWDRRHGMQDLGTLGGGSSGAGSINDSGQVVGISSLAGTYHQHAFLWDAHSGMEDLGTLPGKNESSADGINDAGQVVGFSYLRIVYYSQPPHAFLWDAQNGMQDLGTLPGANGSEARGINDAGEVVGDSGGHAFLYSDGTMVDLNNFLPPDSGWALNAATAINGSGQIVGYGTIGGRFRAFLLTLDGGDHPGAVAFSSSTGLEMIQVAGTLADARGTSAGSVSGALVGIGQTGQARPGPGPVTEVTSAVSSAPSQGSPAGLMGRQGGSTAHRPLDGFGDPVVDPLTPDSLGITT